MIEHHVILHPSHIEPKTQGAKDTYYTQTKQSRIGEWRGCLNLTPNRPISRNLEAILLKAGLGLTAPEPIDLPLAAEDLLLLHP